MNHSFGNNHMYFNTRTIAAELVNKLPPVMRSEATLNIVDYVLNSIDAGKERNTIRNMLYRSASVDGYVNNTMATLAEVIWCVISYQNDRAGNAGQMTSTAIHGICDDLISGLAAKVALNSNEYMRTVDTFVVQGLRQAAADFEGALTIHARVKQSANFTRASDSGVFAKNTMSLEALDPNYKPPMMTANGLSPAAVNRALNPANTSLTNKVVNNKPVIIEKDSEMPILDWRSNGERYHYYASHVLQKRSIIVIDNGVYTQYLEPFKFGGSSVFDSIDATFLGLGTVPAENKGNILTMDEAKHRILSLRRQAAVSNPQPDEAMNSVKLENVLPHSNTENEIRLIRNMLEMFGESDMDYEEYVSKVDLADTHLTCEVNDMYYQCMSLAAVRGHYILSRHRAENNGFPFVYRTYPVLYRLIFANDVLVKSLKEIYSSFSGGKYSKVLTAFRVIDAEYSDHGTIVAMLNNIMTSAINRRLKLLMSVDINVGNFIEDSEHLSRDFFTNRYSTIGTMMADAYEYDQAKETELLFSSLPTEIIPSVMAAISDLGIYPDTDPVSNVLDANAEIPFISAQRHSLTAVSCTYEAIGVQFFRNISILVSESELPVLHHIMKTALEENAERNAGACRFFLVTTDNVYIEFAQGLIDKTSIVAMLVDEPVI